MGGAPPIKFTGLSAPAPASSLMMKPRKWETQWDYSINLNMSTKIQLISLFSLQLRKGYIEHAKENLDKFFD